ncbi:hypothetical protein H5410_057419, partial [Solanum commersonii]
TLSTKACRDWYGVICFNGRTNKLKITDAGLSGIIPPTIGNLTNLVYLDLSINKISGKIPPQIGSL